MKMNVCYVLLLALSIGFSSASHNICNCWWSLGVHEISQSTEILSPDECLFLCLTAHQQDVCVLDSDIITEIAVGVRQGIVQCQEHFAGTKWNCTTFVGAYLFGAFMENNCTRETAVVDSLLAATASVNTAVACRDEKLHGCTCSISGIPGPDEEGNFVTYDCDHNMEQSAGILEEFLKCNSSDCSVDLKSAIRHHNIRAGLEVAKETEASCRCTGYSGSCAVQSCYHRSLDLDIIGAKIRALYDIAVKVLCSTDSEEDGGVLVPENPNVPDIRTTDLVYVDQVNFCEADPEQGILGTKDRECDISDNSPNSCSVLCCGRGAYRIVVTQPVEHCEFVWCCEIVCTIIRYEEISTYYCN